MKSVIILLLMAMVSMNFMCSGATLECEDIEVFNEIVKPGSFTWKSEIDAASYDHLKIVIITDGVKSTKTIKPESMKEVDVDEKTMWETPPIFITETSQVIIYKVICEYVY